MRRMPKFALFCTLAAVTAVLVAERWSPTRDGHRVAFSLAMASGQVHLQAAIGKSEVMLRL